jgi:CsoR family transcriptional regulator, copper-sensing transcriptional repressor
MSRDAARSRLIGARGHLDAVVRMLDEDVYCIDVLHQLSAVTGALESARRELLDGHLRTCVKAAFEVGEVDGVVEELTEALFGRRVPSAGPARRCHHDAVADARSLDPEAAAASSNGG